MSEQIRVCFLSQDSSLGAIVGRTLGDGFETRTSDEFQGNRLNELREWCDVLLIDMRSAGPDGDFEVGTRMMDEISKLPSHPPMVVLCDGENRSLLDQCDGTWRLRQRHESAEHDRAASHFAPRREASHRAKRTGSLPRRCARGADGFTNCSALRPQCRNFSLWRKKSRRAT